MTPADTSPRSPSAKRSRSNSFTATSPLLDDSSHHHLRGFTRAAFVGAAKGIKAKIFANTPTARREQQAALQEGGAL